MARSFLLVILFTVLAFPIAPSGHCQDRNYLILQPDPEDPEVKPPLIVGGVLISDRYRACTIVLFNSADKEHIHIILRSHTEAGSPVRLSYLVFSRERRTVNDSEEFPAYDSTLINAFYRSAGRGFSWFEYPDRGIYLPFDLPTPDQLNVTRDSRNRLLSIDGVLVRPALISAAKGECFEHDTLVSFRGKNNIYLKRGTCSNGLKTASFNLTAINLIAVLHASIVAQISPDVVGGSLRRLENAPREFRLEPEIDNFPYHNVIDCPGGIGRSGREMKLSELRVVEQDCMQSTCVQLSELNLNFSPGNEDGWAQGCAGWESSDDDPERLPPQTCKGWDSPNNDWGDWGDGGGNSGSQVY